MSSTIIDAPDAAMTASATPDVETHLDRRIHSAWLVAVAVVAAVTLGLTLAGQSAAGPSTPGASAATLPAVAVAPAAVAESVGAGLLALAWELTTPPQRDAACAQFTANADSAWTAYSSAAQTVATRTEFEAFFSATC